MLSASLPFYIYAIRENNANQIYLTDIILGPKHML